MDDMKPGVFRVELVQRSNKLTAHVDVVSITSSHAKRFAARQFFGGNGSWTVTGVTKLRDYSN